MDYDKLIINCEGDCDNCAFFLECQYQTTPDEKEKQVLLAKLIERDNAKAQQAVEEQPVEEPTEEVVEEQPAEEPTEEVVEEQPTEEPTEEVVEEQPAEEPTEEVVEEQPTEEPTEEVVEEQPTEEPTEEVVEEQPTEEPTEEVVEDNQDDGEETVDEEPTDEKAETAEEATEEEQQPQEAPAEKEEKFKLTAPENNEYLLANMCCKRGRKLIYRPNETIVSKSFKVLGTDKKNEEGIKVKDILEAEIKQGEKLGYLDKFDGLKSSEIKEEYENDIVYEYAEQEFKKTGVLYDGKTVKVYLYDWDGKACHHVGYIEGEGLDEIIPYLNDREKYSFDVDGIITGGKGKRVIKEGDKIKIVKEKGDPIGLDVDVTVVPRKD